MVTKRITQAEFRACKPVLRDWTGMIDVEWYAREDGRVIGAVLVDRVGDRFGWVLLRKDRSKFVPRAVGASMVRSEEASRSLRDAIERD